MFILFTDHISCRCFIDKAAGAGLTGSKMARRIGEVDEFEFKAVGENHNQGVSIFGFFCRLEVKNQDKL